MASIRKLKSGNYNVQIRRTGMAPVSSTFPSRSAAEQWVKEYDNRSSNPQNCPSFIDLAKVFFSTVNLKASTRAVMCPRAMRISKKLPHFTNKISPKDIIAYRDQRLSEVSSVTVRDELQLINRIIEWGISDFLLENFVDVSPCKNVKLPKPSRPRTKVVTTEELQLLLSHLSPVMQAIVELAYETAMRRSEIVNLRARDINLQEKTLLVSDGKTGDRTVPLTNRAVELLRGLLRGVCKPSDRLFHIRPHSVSTAIRRAREKSGLDRDVRLHQLRHTRITLAAKRGLNQQQLMIVSGHKDSRSVNRYTHLEVTDVLGLIDDV